MSDLGFRDSFLGDFFVCVMSCYGFYDEVLHSGSTGAMANTRGRFGMVWLFFV